MTTSSLAVYRHRGPVIAWLIALISLVFCMVVVGGITRLTESGLSIVEWAPILGVIPPLNEADWQAAFAQYQHSPQYRLVNAGMSLSEFKTIFFWEYVHRLLGRGVGLVFLLPFLFFWLSGCFGSTLARRLLVALFLGGLQGLLGWFMVKSGLVDEPRVSHYRLAAHLGLAFLIMCYLLWVLLGILHEAAPVVRRHPLRGLLGLIAGVTLLQIVYGAFVAGLRAVRDLSPDGRPLDRRGGHGALAMVAEPFGEPCDSSIRTSLARHRAARARRMALGARPGGALRSAPAAECLPVGRGGDCAVLPGGFHAG